MTDVAGRLLARTMLKQAAREPNPVFRLWKREHAANLGVTSPEALDLELAAVCMDLMAFHLEEEGSLPFVDAVRLVLSDLGVPLPMLRPYLPIAYTAASQLLSVFRRGAEVDSPEQVEALARYLPQLVAEGDADHERWASSLAPDCRPYGFAWEPPRAPPNIATVFFRHRPKSLNPDEFRNALAARIDRMLAMEAPDDVAALLAQVTQREGIVFEPDLSDVGLTLVRESRALEGGTEGVFYLRYEDDIVHSEEALRRMIRGDDRLEAFIAGLYEGWQ